MDISGLFFFFGKWRKGTGQRQGGTGQYSNMGGCKEDLQPPHAPLLIFTGLTGTINYSLRLTFYSQLPQNSKGKNVNCGAF